MAETLRICDNTVEVNGVKYFKLNSSYPNDSTKNCGLVGTEVDSNFYFLRGYDIEGISIEGDELVLNRVNGQELRVKLSIEESDSNDRPTITFDKQKGELTFTYPDGEIDVVGGFVFDTLSEIAVGSTLVGNGKINNPLNINPIEVTGYYSPIDEYVDLTVSGNTLVPHKKGYRILTKESADDFGLLYTYQGMKKIQEYLENSGSEWRVPNNSDWTEFLNAIEICGTKDHDVLNSLNGEMASSALKSTEYWETTVDEQGNGTYGSDAYGFRLLPTGNDNDDMTAEEFGRVTYMWAGDDFVRTFHYNSNKVGNYQCRISDCASIRLVKDFTFNNANETEDILGHTYQIVTINEDDYIKLWTKENLLATELNGLELVEGEDYIKLSIPEEIEVQSTCFYINEYTGETDNEGYPILRKKRLIEGDCVSIVNYGEASYRKIQIKNNELYDEYEEIKTRLEEIENRIHNELPDILFGILTGATNEMKITKEGNKIIIGFADDALFG